MDPRCTDEENCIYKSYDCVPNKIIFGSGDGMCGGDNLHSDFPL